MIYRLAGARGSILEAIGVLRDMFLNLGWFEANKKVVE